MDQESAELSQKSVPEPSRKEIWKMFDQISPTYDCANRIMTFGLDQTWRKKLCAFLPPTKNMHILDCATGTGDQITALFEKRKDIAHVCGIDLAEEMLKIGAQKIAKKPYAHQTTFQVASALKIPYPDNHFDCLTIAFGIRNVSDVMAALQEFRRVLKPNGRVLILEGTVPKHPVIKALHLFYLRHILPKMGGLISRNFRAYRYLNQTIETFPQGETFNAKLRAAGFIHVKANPILGGITTVYQGDKSDTVSH